MKRSDVPPMLLFSAFVLLISVLPSFNDLISRPFSKGLSLINLSFEQRSSIQEPPSEGSALNRPRWTHKPICTPHLDPLSSPLCIYTISKFNNNTGISIFTTPSIASSLADLPLSTNSTYHLTQPISSPYRLAAIPGKGHGLLATRLIPRLSTIMITHPVLLARTEMILDTPSREHYLRLALSQLPKATQKRYYELVRMYNIEDFAAQDVVRANSFEIGLADPGPDISALSSSSSSSSSSVDQPQQRDYHNSNEKSGNTFAPTIPTQNGGSTAMHLAIFPEAARLNHACNPNAMYHLDPDTLTHRVFATRDIAVGEELTVSYIGVMQDLRARRKMLREGFGFRCGCGRCGRDEGRLRDGERASSTDYNDEDGAETEDASRQGDTQTQKQDPILIELRARESMLKLFLLNDANYTPPKIQHSQIKEVLRMYLVPFEIEGLEGFMDEAYKLAAVVSWTITRSENSEGVKQSEMYAKRAVEVMGMRFGEGHGDVGVWSGWNGREEKIAARYIEALRS